MGNPQGTLTTYIAGLMDGEGSVWIGTVMTRGHKSYRCTVMFTNTEPALVKTYVDFLVSNGFAYHIRVDDRRKASRRICYGVQITRDKDRKAFLEMVSPYMRGFKKEASSLVIEYLTMRMKKFAEVKRRRLPSGRYGAAVGTKYGKDEENFFKRYKEIKDSSETKCKTPVNFG